jgi:hypothetical protein
MSNWAARFQRRKKSPRASGRAQKRRRCFHFWPIQAGSPAGSKPAGAAACRPRSLTMQLRTGFSPLQRHHRRHRHLLHPRLTTVLATTRIMTIMTIMRVITGATDWAFRGRAAASIAIMPCDEGGVTSLGTLRRPAQQPRRVRHEPVAHASRHRFAMHLSMKRSAQ